MQIKPIPQNDISQVVDIHQQAFESFFLTGLGPDFLNLYYTALLNSEQGLLLGVYEDNELIAFAAATRRAAGFHSTLIKNNPLSFFMKGVKLLFISPISIFRLLRNLTKRGSNDIGEYAELLSIGVATTQQCHGYGKKLLIAVEDILKQSGCRELSLTTDFNENQKSISFYAGLNYRIFSDFITYPNRRMLRLIKIL